MTNEEICRAILHLLNQQSNAHGLGVPGNVAAKSIYANIDAPQIGININIDYLEHKGFIGTIRSLGSHFTAAYLLGPGLSLLRGESEFNRKQPQAVVVTGNQNVVGSNISVSNAFNSPSAASLDPEIKALLMQIADHLKAPEKKGSGLKTLFGKLLEKSTDQALSVAIPLLVKLLEGIF